MGEELPTTTENKLKKTSLNDEAQIIIKALGSKTNIESVEACATRLRLAVVDGRMVDKETIKQLGATAVFEVNGGIQAVLAVKLIYLVKKLIKF